MIMKKIVLVAILGFVSMGAWAQKFIVNDANAEVRKVSSFSAIEVSSAIDLYLSQSDEEGLAVSAKDVESRSRIRTEVNNGVLKIWFDGKGWNWNNGDKKLKAYVSIKNINALSASGASDVHVNGKLTLDALKLHLAGASDFKGEVMLKTLDIHLSGASDAEIKGTASTLSVDASGASELKGYDLITETCNASASGASSVRIAVNKELNASASGASDVLYTGNGVVNKQKSSGASNISKRG
jgi:hypothetical protein